MHEVADDLDAAVERVVRRAALGRPGCGPRREGARAAPQSAEETARRIATHRTSAEGQEGLRAFLEKRAPTWRDGD